MISQLRNIKDKIVDLSLNYGRHIIEDYYKVIPKAERALDIGAGQGYDLILLKQIHRQCDLYAIEFFQPYIDELKKKNIFTVSLDIEKEKFPFSEEYFDIIIANQIFEHLKELFWVMHEISRVLKRKGYLIIGVPEDYDRAKKEL